MPDGLRAPRLLRAHLGQDGLAVALQAVLLQDGLQRLVVHHALDVGSGKAAAQQQRPLSDLELNFLTDFSAQVAKQGELLQNFATQSKIDQLRRG